MIRKKMLLVMMLSLTSLVSCGNQVVPGENSKDSVYVVNTYIDDNGNLICEYSDGTKVDCGAVKNTTKHNVNFYVNNKLVDTQIIEDGKKAKAPSADKTIGYTINSWKSINDGGFNWLFSVYPVTEDLNLYADFDYTVYSITYNLNNGINNSSNPLTYTMDSSTITLEAPSRAGYTFTEWTNSNNEIVRTIPHGSTGNIVLNANWRANQQTLNVSSNNESLGTASITSGTGYTDESITVLATAIDDNVFKGWYIGNTLVSTKNEYTFTMPSESVSLTARFLTKQEAEKLKIAQGITPVFDNNNNTVTYGLYPQSHVSDTTLIDELNELTTTESNGWYLYDDIYYAKLTAKPYLNSYTFDDNTTIVKDTTYWFKCEPIVWKILETSDNTYTLLSTVLLDAHIFDDTSNNYANSEIRTWLNNTFLNSAFKLDSSLIETTNVDNSASTTNSSSNSYACNNTDDKIYLLSYQDYLKSSYGFSTSTSLSTTRACKTTDYARANGSRCITTSSYLYNGDYWTRSPYSSNPTYVSYVDVSGLYGGNFEFTLSDLTDFSVRPSLQIKVSE